MERLKQRILQDGRYLGRGILKVDAFLNHQVDPELMMACGEALARRLSHTRPTKVLTAEISGIAPALAAAYHLGVYLIFARKHRPITLPEDSFHGCPQSGLGLRTGCSLWTTFWPPDRPSKPWPSWCIRPADGWSAWARLSRRCSRRAGRIYNLNVPIESLVRIARFEEDGAIIFAE